MQLIIFPAAVSEHSGSVIGFGLGSAEVSKGLSEAPSPPQEVINKAPKKKYTAGLNMRYGGATKRSKGY